MFDTTHQKQQKKKIKNGWAAQKKLLVNYKLCGKKNVFLQAKWENDQTPQKH